MHFTQAQGRMAPAPFEYFGQFPCHLSSVGDLSGVDLRVEDRWLSVDKTALSRLDEWLNDRQLDDSSLDWKASFVWRITVQVDGASYEELQF